ELYTQSAYFFSIADGFLIEILAPIFTHTQTGIKNWCFCKAICVGVIDNTAYASLPKRIKGLQHQGVSDTLPTILRTNKQTAHSSCIIAFRYLSITQNPTCHYLIITHDEAKTLCIRGTFIFWQY